MNKLLNSRNLSLVNLLIVTYFVGLYLVNFYQVDHKLVGVLGELLTVPFLIAMVLFLAIGIKYLTERKKQTITVISIGLLGLCAIATVKSFF